MKNIITDIRLYRATSTLSKPIADATHQLSEISFYIAEVVTAEGVTGQGYLLSFHYSPDGVLGALKDARRFVLERGYATHETIRMKADYDNESEYFGSTGLQRWAQAVLNVASWDAWCKSLSQPIWKVLGGSYKKIPVYGSGGWISYTDDELLDEVLDYKARGFMAVKIKVGSAIAGRDYERLRKVREAVGPGINIMMDANQGMDAASAIKLSSQVEGLGIHWFEEPVANTDFDGYQTIRNKTGIALAMGEREYDTTALRELIRKNALDLWQPDLLRIGGVDEWRASAAIAGAYNLPVLPHYYKDYDVPLLATIPNAYGAESFDWVDGIIDKPMKIENGFVYPREGNGWGFVFKPECLQEITYV